MQPFWTFITTSLVTTRRFIGPRLVVNFYLAPAAESLILSHGGTTYSQTYLLRDVKALCSMCTISDELMESVQGQLLSGSALRIPMKKIELFILTFHQM